MDCDCSGNNISDDGKRVLESKRNKDTLTVLFLWWVALPHVMKPLLVLCCFIICNHDCLQRWQHHSNHPFSIPFLTFPSKHSTCKARCIIQLFFSMAVYFQCVTSETHNGWVSGLDDATIVIEWWFWWRERQRESSGQSMRWMVVKTRWIECGCCQNTNTCESHEWMKAQQTH